MADNLYSILETNTDETKNCNVNNIEMLFDLEGDSYKISNSEFDKNIICVCGSCDLIIEKNNRKDVIALNNPKVTIYVSKDVKAELKNYTKETKVFVGYLGENNE